jgi:iron(III) transport system ATP-binding protein
VFRPQVATIAAAGTAACPDCRRFRGKVRHLEFLGSIIRYGVEVDGNLLLVDDTHRKGHPTFAPDSEVILDVPEEQITLLTRENAQPE